MAWTEQTQNTKENKNKQIQEVLLLEGLKPAIWDQSQIHNKKAQMSHTFNPNLSKIKKVQKTYQ